MRSCISGLSFFRVVGWCLGIREGVYGRLRRLEAFLCGLFFGGESGRVRAAARSV